MKMKHDIIKLSAEEGDLGDGVRSLKGVLVSLSMDSKTVDPNMTISEDRFGCLYRDMYGRTSYKVVRAEFILSSIQLEEGAEEEEVKVQSSNREIIEDLERALAF